MEGNVSNLTKDELEKKISELEQVYTEFFVNNEDAGQLDKVHKRIMELRHELEKRKVEDVKLKQGC